MMSRRNTTACKWVTLYGLVRPTIPEDSGRDANLVLEMERSEGDVSTHTSRTN